MEKDKKIFITGAAGFVGSNLAYKFLKEGGLVYVTVPNIKGFSKRFKKDKWTVAKDESHVNLLSENRWKHMFEVNSLVVEKSFTEGYLDPPYVKYVPKAVQEMSYLLGIMQFRTKMPVVVNGDQLHYMLRKGRFF